MEMSSAFQPDVLITDYRLEDEVTGVEVIVKLRKVGRPLTCVLITGVLHEALREALQRIQGVIILAKPVSLERLRQIISAA